MLDKPTKVLDFGQFVMKHRRAVLTTNEDMDGRDLALVFSQIKVSKSITIERGIGKKSINGVMVEIDIAGEKQNLPVELPETITINVPLFLGDAHRDVEIDILAYESREEVWVTMTAATLQEARVNAFEAMVAEMQAQLPDTIIGMGRIQQRDWKWVR